MRLFQMVDKVLDGDIGNSLPQDSGSEITPTDSTFPRGQALDQASVIAFWFKWQFYIISFSRNNLERHSFVLWLWSQLLIPGFVKEVLEEMV